MIELHHMKYIPYIVAVVFASVIAVQGMQISDLKEKNATHENALKEIAGVISASGIIVPDKDGKPTVNTLLLEAWKQSNLSSI